MSHTTDSGIPVPEPGSPSPSKKHFDTFETKFFQEGDESAGSASKAEGFDDLEDVTKIVKLAPSRKFIKKVAIGSACIAIIGCMILWRSSSHTPAKPATSIASEEPTPAEPSPAAPVAVPAQAEPAPAPPAQSAAPAEAQAQPAAAQAIPSAAPGPAQPPAQPIAAEQPAAPAVAAPSLPPTPAPAVASANEVQQRCKKAIADRRNKEILAACADAFNADPSAAEFAVALARIEFDRGRAVQALAWGKKAVAANANAADAYVFIGGAEQTAGHGKAAKEAYQRYLQLAPKGQYAADIRAIVSSL
jgi:hypothetical protein